MQMETEHVDATTTMRDGGFVGRCQCDQRARAGCRHPGSADDENQYHAAAARAGKRAVLSAGGHAQRLDLALAPERRLEEVSSPGRTVEREFAPGMTVHLWGYNGQSPGPTIECVEGDKVRIFVTNKLPEHTTVHWHGMLVPNGMDGVGGVTQPHIEPGKTFVYEFQLKASGTFMYHPHSDEMVQMGM